MACSMETLPARRMRSGDVHANYSNDTGHSAIKRRARAQRAIAGERACRTRDRGSFGSARLRSGLFCHAFAIESGADPHFAPENVARVSKRLAGTVFIL